MIRYLSKTSPRALKGVALLRLDFNTEDNWRMRAATPTIKFLLRYASKILIVSHKGRPLHTLIRANGRIVGAEKKLGLLEDAKTLERLLRKKVNFIPRFNFKRIDDVISRAREKSIFVLENIRFLKSESTKKPELAKQLAQLVDYYVNDAFAVSHRSSDSVAKIEKFLPSYAGLELEAELKSLTHILAKPKQPLVLILGGSKASDKLGIIKNLKGKVDLFILGGAPANTIFFLKGMDVKKSLRDRDRKDLKNLKAILNYPNLCLPADFKWKDGAILDIGEKTIKVFEEKIKNARTIFWNGPMGLMEKKPYDKGTLALARAIVKNRKAFTIAGGGETVMFLKKHKLDTKFSFISTGGGAMLDFLAGKKLPGIEALKYGKR
ncbi:MAG: phosphoglycerate kinase [Candidatus Liptonbacteria bacterium]|nr:phosphoglycerate kinase [Candidatus Liptonbacteria bacterium]